MNCDIANRSLRASALRRVVAHAQPRAKSIALAELTGASLQVASAAAAAHPSHETLVRSINSPCFALAVTPGGMSMLSWRAIVLAYSICLAEGGAAQGVVDEPAASVAIHKRLLRQLRRRLLRETLRILQFFFSLVAVHHHNCPQTREATCRQTACESRSGAAPVRGTQRRPRDCRRPEARSRGGGALRCAWVAGVSRVPCASLSAGRNKRGPSRIYDDDEEEQSSAVWLSFFVLSLPPSPLPLTSI